MLIRFVIENLFSFGESKEFTTIPKKRLKTFQEHKYNYDGFEILKLSSIYGANGAGKSNLIKSLFQFQKLVTVGLKSRATSLFQSLKRLIPIKYRIQTGDCGSIRK